MEILEKYDIGIVGNWSNRNYGAGLTYYALYCTLSDLNYRVLMIEGVRDDTVSEMLPTPGLFRYNPYPDHTLVKAGRDHWEEIEKRIDTYVVGSDQLWRYLFFKKYRSANLLSQVSHDKRKISYATSFGEKNFQVPDSYISKMRFFLSSFQKISVREKSGVDICSDILHVRAEHVLDPVFLCDTRHYEALISKSEISLEEPFIFCYIIHPTAEKKRLYQRIANKYNQKIIFVCTPYKIPYEGWNINFKADCRVEEWLYYLYHCDMVITDSFHAFCFSILFQKQIIPLFQTVNGSDSAERIHSLADMLGFPPPAIIDHPVSNICIPHAHMEYEHIEKRLESEKKRCKKWLLDALETDISYDKSDLLWDVIRPEINKIFYLEQIVAEQKREINRLKYGDRNIVLFGAGRILEQNYEEIFKNIKVSAITDNNTGKWGLLHNGIECIPPHRILKICDPYVLITVKNDALAIDIRNQLNNMGIMDVALLSEWLSV